MVPHTLSEDIDHIDFIVITPFPIVQNCIIKCRSNILLKMKGELRVCSKVIAVPVNKYVPYSIKQLNDLLININFLNQISLLKLIQGEKIY